MREGSVTLSTTKIAQSLLNLTKQELRQ